jgi:hypothetical protein
MRDAAIVAGDTRIDGRGDLASCLQVEQELARQGHEAVELVVDPLHAGWDTPLEKRHYRSGCGPLEALADGRNLIAAGLCSVVVISGEDLLKTGYDREERHRLMAIYGPDFPLPQAYTALAYAFLDKIGMSEQEFRRLSALLFENYMRTARRSGHGEHPAERWFEPVTELFRGVDCANPVVDFAGRLVLCSDDVADAAAIPPRKRVSVLGVGLDVLAGDGPAFVREIAEFKHLEGAYRDACAQADIDFKARFLAGEVLLDVYTCYPVVPLAFLLGSRLAADPAAIPALLERFDITVTGGMNLGRAAWNNPALNALIAVYHRLLEGPPFLGAVHGNGGLGYKQGVALLERKAAEREA